MGKQDSRVAWYGAARLFLLFLLEGFKMKSLSFFISLILCLLLMITQANSAPLQPLSYDMINGGGQAQGALYNYWDKNYSGWGSVSGFGPKTTTYENLSGGLGDLTDGIITSYHWYQIENISGTGPYVGWQLIENGPIVRNLTITFHFQQTVTIDEIGFHADNENFYNNGKTPKRVEITTNSKAYGFDIPDDLDFNPKFFNFSGLDLQSDSVDITFYARGGGGRAGEWVFIDEVTFNGVSAPLPSTLWLLGPGLLGLVRLGRLRKS
jgi:hypothetical protein